MTEMMVVYLTLLNKQYLDPQRIHRAIPTSVKMTIKRIQLLFTLVLAFKGVLSADNNSPCITPDQKNGKCVVINLCPEIENIVKDSNSSQIEFAQKSQCGFLDTLPLVCCKSPSSNLYDNIFTTVKPKILVEYYKLEGLPDRTVCGLVRTNDKIYNGNQTDIGEFPWAAGLCYKNSQGLDIGILCGGTLVHARFVLTAAHCLANPDNPLYLILLGEWSVVTDPDCTEDNECADPVLKVPIEKEFPHPFYSKRFRNNDIGLVRLKYDVQFTGFVRPICLPPVNLPTPKIGEKMTVIGWGLTEKNERSDILLKVELPLVSNSECIEAFSGNEKITTNTLCAGGSEYQDSCQGDSGGPLLRTYLDSKRLQWYQEGVVAFGLECGHEIPAVYTRVSKYVNWIIRKLIDNYDN